MIKLRQLVLQNFRSHRETKIEIPGLKTLILGPNGGGKTTIAEAVQLLLAGRSNLTDARGGAAHRLILDGCDGFRLEAKISVFGIDHELPTHVGEHTITRTLTAEGVGYFIDDHKMAAGDYERIVGEWVGDRRLAYAALSTGGLQMMAPKDRGAAVEYALGVAGISWEAFGDSPLTHADSEDEPGLAVAKFTDDLDAVEDSPLAEALTGIKAMEPGKSWSQELIAEWFKVIDRRRLELARDLAATRAPRPDGSKPNITGYKTALDAACGALNERITVEGKAEQRRDRATTKLESSRKMLAELIELAEETDAKARAMEDSDEVPTESVVESLRGRVAVREAVLEALRKISDETQSDLDDLRAGKDPVLAEASNQAQRAALAVTTAEAQVDVCQALPTCDREHEHCDPIAVGKGALGAAESGLDAAQQESEGLGATLKRAIAANNKRIVDAEVEFERHKGEREEAFRAREEAKEELVAVEKKRDDYLTATKQTAEIRVRIAAKEAEIEELEAQVKGCQLLVEGHEREAKVPALTRARNQAQEQHEAALKKLGAWEAWEAYTAAGDRSELEAEHERLKRLAAAFGPSGVRQSYTSSKADALRDRFRKTVERLSAGSVKVNFAPFNVELEGRDSDLASGSEKWRVAVAMQLALAELGGLGLCVIDRGDILVGDRWPELLELIGAYPGQVILCAAAATVEPAVWASHAEVLWCQRFEGGPSQVTDAAEGEALGEAAQ